MADVSKQDVVDAVADATGSSKADANKAVDAVIDCIKGSLAAGKSVGLIGFGTFEVRERAPREGRNPQTGATIKIGAKKVPAFKAGKGLRDAV
ncbi:HU family DNA-binding protein [Candidatus Poribacteria bacterium]|nr:HU family DNA-binding protein [Candidatus Poribacteria bacterium]